MNFTSGTQRSLAMVSWEIDSINRPHVYCRYSKWYFLARAADLAGISGVPSPKPRKYPGADSSWLIRRAGFRQGGVTTGASLGFANDDQSTALEKHARTRRIRVPNDEVERRGVASTKNRADLSRSSTPSLAHRRRNPRSLESIVRRY